MDPACTHTKYATSIAAKKAIAQMASSGNRRTKIGKAERCGACGKWKVTV